MNIAIYLGANQGDPIDARQVVSGNPGVGGTQYVMLLLAHYLALDPKYQVYILSSRKYILSGGGNIEVKNDSQLVNKCKQQGIDILLLRSHSEEIRRDIAKSSLKVIYWSHNFVYADFSRFVSRTPQVKCNVFVGKQQYDRYIDADLIKKSITIFNLFNDNCRQPRQNDSRTVIYLGSIVEGKGFYELCRIWPGIVKKVPNARLLVMGSGKLYGNKKLGKYGIAEEKYENKFIPYITDEKGVLIPSVEFLGIVGEDKTDRFLSASVGVVNPSGRTETFGMGVVEMAAATLPVVTIAKDGYLDTVISGRTGILAPSLIEIQRNIIRLLKEPDMNVHLGTEAKEFIKKFSPEEIVLLWKQLLDDVYHDRLEIKYSSPIPPFSSNFKWLRRIIRFIRFDMRLSFMPALCDAEYLVIKLRNRLRRM